MLIPLKTLIKGTLLFDSEFNIRPVNGLRSHEKASPYHFTDPPNWEKDVYCYRLIDESDYAHVDLSNKNNKYTAITLQMNYQEPNVRLYTTDAYDNDVESIKNKRYFIDPETREIAIQGRQCHAPYTLKALEAEKPLPVYLDACSHALLVPDAGIFPLNRIASPEYLSSIQFYKYKNSYKCVCIWPHIDINQIYDSKIPLYWHDTTVKHPVSDNWPAKLPLPTIDSKEWSNYLETLRK